MTTIIFIGVIVCWSIVFLYGLVVNGNDSVMPDSRSNKPDNDSIMDAFFGSPHQEDSFDYTHPSDAYGLANFTGNPYLDNADTDREINRSIYFLVQIDDDNEQGHAI